MLKPTKGTYKIIGEAISKYDINGTFMEHIARCPNSTPENWENNAPLIAEAFNILQETSLTPRQLDDQRRELLGILEEIEPLVKEYTTEHYGCGSGSFNKIRATLTKAKGETKI